MGRFVNYVILKIAGYMSNEPRRRRDLLERAIDAYGIRDALEESGPFQVEPHPEKAVIDGKVIFRSRAKITRGGRTFVTNTNYESHVPVGYGKEDEGSTWKECVGKADELVQSCRRLFAEAGVRTG